MARPIYVGCHHLLLITVYQKTCRLEFLEIQLQHLRLQLHLSATKLLYLEGFFDVVYAEKEKYPFIYKRGKFVVVVNPSSNDETVPFDFDVASTLYQIGKTEVKDNKVTAYGSSFAIFEVK